MNREFLRGLGLDKEIEDKIMAEHGKDIQAEKDKATKASSDLTQANQTIETYKTQIEELKKTVGDNADAAKRLKDLQDEIAEKERLANEKAADEQLTATIKAALPQRSRLRTEKRAPA